jgi:hypothetical protein
MSVLSWLFGCRHRAMYLERRERDGCQVMHYVCESCGHAVPVVARSGAEYRVNALSQVGLPKAKPRVIPSAAERSRTLAVIAGESRPR